MVAVGVGDCITQIKFVTTLSINMINDISLILFWPEHSTNTPLLHNIDLCIEQHTYRLHLTLNMDTTEIGRDKLTLSRKTRV